MDIDKRIKKLLRIVKNTKPKTCRGCKFIHPDSFARSCSLMDGGFDSVIEYELSENIVAYDCPLLAPDSEEYKEISELLEILVELKEARGKLKAIEDIAREILNRPNTKNTRVNLKRALTDILDISKSGEEGKQ